MNTIAITFQNISTVKSEVLIAMLQNTAFNGIEEHDNMLCIYYNEKNFDLIAIQEITTQLGLTFEIKTIEEQNWNETWEKSFEPICIENKVAVRADFHKPYTHCEYEIIITPKMSFGTGHHPTTRLILALMYDMSFYNTSVLDFGCGTGVLSIFAEKKGATQLDAIDNDKWSIENTQENILKNNCQYISVSDQDITTLNGRYDYILANINLHILISYAHTLYELLKSEGIIILSGVLISDEIKILDVYLKNGFVLKKKQKENEWIALCLQKAGN